MLEGAIFPFSRAQSTDAFGDIFEVHAGLQICPLWIREDRLALHGCLGADAGAMLLVGTDAVVADRERVIGQAHAALRVHWDVVGPLTVRLGLHLLVPFRHEAFIAEVGGVSTTLYKPEPVAGMFDLGVGIHVD